MPPRLEVLRAAWGGMQLLAPDAAVRPFGLRLDDRSRAVVRVLGARQLLQAAGTAIVPTRAVRRLGVLVDGLHAASMVALAVADPARRRLALTDTALASAWLAAGTLRARR